MKQSLEKPLGDGWYWGIVAVAGSIFAGGIAAAVCLCMMLAGYLAFGQWPDSPAALMAARIVFGGVFAPIMAMILWAAYGVQQEETARARAAACQAGRDIFRASQRKERHDIL